MECKKCQSEKVVKNGKDRGGNQRYKCKSCNKTFVDKKPILASQTELPSKINLQVRRILRDVLIGFILTLFMIGVKIIVEHKYGEGILLTTYDFLQTFLSDDSNSVVVVDISNLPSPQVTSDRPLTDRKKLQELVKFIAEQNIPPRAIGIDIDFSPVYGIVSSTPEFLGKDDDIDFFNLCLELRKKGVPVFLGLGKSYDKESDKWLVRSEYQYLAAHTFLQVEHNKYYWYSIKTHENSQKLKSFSSSLADEYGNLTQQPPNWLQNYHLAEFVTEEEIGEKENEKIEIEKFLINFAPIEKLVDERIQAVKADGEIDFPKLQEEKEKMAGKIVIIGIGDENSKKGSDVSVAGFRRKGYKPVYVQASAVYTLTEKPLYELTFWGHLLIDILLSISIIGFVALWRLYYVIVKKSDKAIHSHKLPKRITIVTLLVALIVGVLFINLTQIMWVDFVLVIIALLLHLIFEGWIDKVIEFLKHHSPIKKALHHT